MYRRNITNHTITISTLVDRTGKPLRLLPGKGANFENARRWDPRVVAKHKALLDRYVRIGEMSDVPLFLTPEPEPRRKTKPKRKSLEPEVETVAPEVIDDDIMGWDSEHSPE